MENKKRNTIILVLLAVVTIVVGFVFLFGVDFGLRKIVPLNKELKKGFEFGGGRYSVFTISEEEKVEEGEDDLSAFEGLPEGAVKVGTVDDDGNPVSDSQDEAGETPEKIFSQSELLVREKYRDQVVERMTTRWDAEPFYGVKIYKQDKDKIRIDIPKNMRLGAVNPEGLIQDVLNYLTITANFEMKDSEGELLFDSSNIAESRYVQLSEYEFGVQVFLDDTGKKILADYTSELDYESIGADDNSRVVSFSQDGYEVAQLQIEKSLDEGIFILQNNLDIMSAFRLANLINSGPFSAEIEPVTSFGVDGNSPIKFETILIALAIAFVIGLILLVVVYKWSGIWTAFAGLITLLLAALGGATIESAVFTYAGLAGAIAGLAVIFGLLTLLADNMQKSTSEDSVPSVTAANTFKNTIFKVISFAVPMFLACAAAAFLGNAYVGDFAKMLMITTAFALVGYLIAYGILRLGTVIVNDPKKYIRSKSEIKTLDASENNIKNNNK